MSVRILKNNINLTESIKWVLLLISRRIFKFSFPFNCMNLNYNAIILSGLPVSGKSTLARRLSEIYDWPVHSFGDLWREKWSGRYPNGEVTFEEFWRGTTIEENHQMNIEAVEMFKEGKGIIDTRYTLYFKDLPFLFAFITAPLDVRAKRAKDSGKYVGKSLSDIVSILKEREQDELTFGGKLLGEDYDYRDPKHYHLGINSGNLTVEQEVSLVTGLVGLATIS